MFTRGLHFGFHQQKIKELTSAVSGYNFAQG